METFLTVIAGVLVFVISQIVVQVWLEPLQQLKSAIVDISETLTKHEGSIISLAVAPPEARRDISRDMAVMSARLSGRRELIPFYETARRMYSLPSETKIHEAIGSLNALSNYVAGSHKNAAEIASYCNQEIREALGLFIEPSKRLDPSLKMHFIVDAQPTVQADGPASGGPAA